MTFYWKKLSSGVVAKDGAEVWTTAELDFDPYSEGATTGGKVFRMRDGMLVLESEDGTELWRSVASHGRGRRAHVDGL